MVSVLFTGLIGLIQKQFEDQKIKRCEISKQLPAEVEKIIQFFYWKKEDNKYVFGGQDIGNCYISTFMQPMIYVLLVYYLDDFVLQLRRLYYLFKFFLFDINKIII
jgi:hypothetical protein